jgi:hypothetical protein
MLVTLAGMITDLRLAEKAKVASSMSWIPSGILKEAALLAGGYAINLVTPVSKSAPSITVKLALPGSTAMEASVTFFENAPTSILVTDAGIVMEVTATSLNASLPMLSSWLPGANVIEVSCGEFINDLVPMLLTLAGIVTEVNAEFRKATFPILVTPDGITTAPVQLPPLDTAPVAIV